MTNLTEPIRSRVRRLSIAEGTYFLTTNTHTHTQIFSHEKNIELLRQTMREAKQYHPFTMKAYAFMPDHLHLLLSLSLGTEISLLMQSIKRNFTRNYKSLWGSSGQLKLWQRSFYDHVVRNEQDYVNHIHYIHYNPVKHGYVSRPEDYPHTSYLEYVKRGWYEIGWGHQEQKSPWINLYQE
jgi:putative transposase